MPKNQAGIAGDQNVVIQGINWSNIQITQKLNPVEFAEELQKLIHPKKPICVLILSVLPEKLKTELDKNKSNFTFKDVCEHYGKEYKDWKPYLSEKQLIELLNDYQKESGFDITVFFIDNPYHNIPQDFIDELKLLIKELVLIVDTFSLFFKGNQLIVKEFNSIHIGGCLIPLMDATKNTNEIKSFVAQKIRENLGSLHNYTSNYAKFIPKRADNGLIHIDLEVPDKHTLFRRLTAIATLGFSEKRERQAHISAFGNEIIHNSR
ncbi:MAG: hypothetical protein EAZ97_14140 [Bacteroidetes bacterium]|nr:MAG: hypothetical protein EAZ97_14140 [Bacteroidota bacterium]